MAHNQECASVQGACIAAPRHSPVAEAASSCCSKRSIYTHSVREAATCVCHRILPILLSGLHTLRCMQPGMPMHYQPHPVKSEASIEIVSTNQVQKITSALCSCQHTKNARRALIEWQAAGTGRVPRRACHPATALKTLQGQICPAHRSLPRSRAASRLLRPAAHAGTGGHATINKKQRKLPKRVPRHPTLQLKRGVP